MTTPAFGSAGLALLFEVPMCTALSLGGARGFAWYLVTGGVGADAGGEGVGEVADITAYMWRTVDWVSLHAASILPSYSHAHPYHEHLKSAKTAEGHAHAEHAQHAGIQTPLTSI
jgi:hypothetical protein